MIMVNIYEAKAKLSEYVEAAGRGEQVLICKHNRPVAELRAIEPARANPRDLTPMYPGVTFATAGFFEPLSADEIDAWEGRARGDVLKVAEERASYSPKPHRQKSRPRR